MMPKGPKGPGCCCCIGNPLCVIVLLIALAVTMPVLTVWLAIGAVGYFCVAMTRGGAFSKKSTSDDSWDYPEGKGPFGTSKIRRHRRTERGCCI